MEAGTYRKPLPVPDDSSDPFWEEARHHRLAFQRCRYCGARYHPPVAFCSHCHRIDEPSFDFAEVAPRGRIVNWTIIHDAMVVGFEDEAPWVHAVVELEGHPGLLFSATLEDGPTDGLRLDATVEIVFHDVSPEISLPFLRLQTPAPSLVGG